MQGDFTKSPGRIGNSSYNVCLIILLIYKWSELLPSKMEFWREKLVILPPATKPEHPGFFPSKG
jgi:hypothetical protein